MHRWRRDLEVSLDVRLRRWPSVHLGMRRDERKVLALPVGERRLHLIARLLGKCRDQPSNGSPRQPRSPDNAWERGVEGPTPRGFQPSIRMSDPPSWTHTLRLVPSPLLQQARKL